MRKLIAALLILLGLGVISIPLADYAYEWYWQRQIALAYAPPEEDISGDIQHAYAALSPILNEGESEPGEEGDMPLPSPTPDQPRSSASIPGPAPDETVAPADSSAPPTKQPEPTPQPTPKPLPFVVLGTMDIPKIDSSLPILEGTGKSQLRVGVGYMEGTSAIGEAGNAAFAAHRSHTYGRMFNRLDELENGDTITITLGDATYTYQVYEKLVVEPDDVSVLKSSKDKKVITLITCTPLITATHRLIIHASQVN